MAPTTECDLDATLQPMDESFICSTICTEKGGGAAQATESEDTTSKRISVPSTERTKIPRPSSKKTGSHNLQKSKEAESVSIRRISFRTRKSLSLMEIQRHRKSSRPPKAILHHQQEQRNSVHSLAVSAAVSAAVSSRGDSCCYDRSSVKIRNDFYCFVNDSDAECEVDSKLAGMRVFASIMLNAWRRRRDEVRCLNDELNRIKKGSIKTKNQLHVISSLFKVEQKTNDDLSCRFHHCLDDQKKIQDMYNDLNKAFSALQTKCHNTEQCLGQKTGECEDLNFLLGESKSSLFKSMSRERELERNLSSEQRKITELENEKNDLWNTIAKLEGTAFEKSNEHQNVITARNTEIARLNRQLDILEKKLNDLKNKESQVKGYEKLDVIQRKFIQELTDRANALQTAFENSWYTRTLAFLKVVPTTTFQYCHLLTFCLLPLTPPPTKFQLHTPMVLGKALNFRWN